MRHTRLTPLLAAVLLAALGCGNRTSSAEGSRPRDHAFRFPQAPASAQSLPISKEQPGMTPTSTFPGSDAMSAAEREAYFAIGTRKVKAPSLEQADGWLFSPPLDWETLKGRVVLLDFWTFGCINCIHMIPHLRALEEKYGPDGLVVIGVHTANSAYEGDPEAIKQAALRYGIAHPIAVDSEMKVWSSFYVNAWPTFALVDQEGYLRFKVAGEGVQGELDEKIGALLAFGSAGPLPTPEMPSDFVAVPASPLRFPGKIHAEAGGERLFIADSSNHRILITNKSGVVQDTIGTSARGDTDGGFETAQLDTPQGLTLHAGKLYIADTENHKIKVADLAARTVTTLAGNGIQGWEDGPALTSNLNSPWDLVFSGDDLIIANAGNHMLKLYTPDTQLIVTLGGNGREATLQGNSNEGNLRTASFAQPSGLALDGDLLYVADSEVHSVREVDLSQGEVRTVAGGGYRIAGDKDAEGRNARFQHPLGVAVAGGTLYVLDSYNNKLKTLDPTSRVAKSLALDTEFAEPGGIATDGQVLWIADTNNHRIVRLDPATGEVTTLMITGAPSTVGEPLKPRLGYEER